MKSILALALCLGSSAAHRLHQRFATGMNGDEDLGEDIIMKGEPYHYHQKHEPSLLQTESRWVELPDCGTLGTDDVPLKDDLSNAIIATCKAYNPNYVPYDPTTAPPPPPTKVEAYQTQWGTNYSYWAPDPIYDPIFHTKYPIAEHEHQVVQHEQGHIESTDGSQGPHGDWYSHGKPSGGDEWPQEHIAFLVQIY